MDQVKVVLQVLKKHHFWLLCVVCLIAGIVGWNMAARKLSAAYTARKSEIESKFSALDTIKNAESFPNARWAEEVEKLTKEQKTKVRRTWKSVFDEQATMLKWPAWTTPPKADMPLSYREQYASKVADEFANLLAIVGAESPDAAKLAVTQGTKSKGTVVHEDKVIWESTSQESIQKRLQLVAPSALEVLLTQEDLWAYQVLLTIIKNVNAGKYVPPVKEITTLTVAKKAAESFERGLASGVIETPATVRASAVAAGAAAAAPDAGIPGGPPPAPDDGRYLDRDGKPMKGGTAEKDQFKRLPVCMGLVIDQREIPKLLVECANSTLPVEIRQLRVNPSKGAISSEKRASRASTDSNNERNAFEVPIEICGIIYIYNPPDTSKLGAETEGEAAPAAPAAAGPAGAPAGGAQAAVAPGG